MDKTSREKFLDIRISDQVWYLDPDGARCEGLVSGWINHNNDPALLVGAHGSRIVALAQVLSRTRGNDTRQWTNSVDTEAKLQAAYQEAKDMLEQCEEELLNAQSMDNKPRIAQCRKWREEAAYHEQEARKALTEVK